MAPAGMGTDVAEIPRGTEIGATGIARGWNLFLREPRADALDILPMIKKSDAGVTILGKLSREMAAWASARRGKWGQVTPWKNG